MSGDWISGESKSAKGRTEGEGVENGSLDSYGLKVYHCKCAGPKTSLSSEHVHIPWELRQSSTKKRFSFFSVLVEPQFWLQVDFATRITLFAVLLPSVIIAADIKGSPFISPFFVFSAGVLAAKVTVGEMVAYLFTWFRAGILWLPLSVLAAAVHLGDYVVGWCFYYTLVLFLMAVLTENMSRRICLLLFNTCMMSILLDTSRGTVYPCRVMVDWCIGTGLCFVSCFFPFPRLCKSRAHATLKNLALNTGTAFQGLGHCFWSKSNVDRNLAFARVRAMTHSLDELLPLFEHHQGVSQTEFFCEYPSTREIRDIKFSFFERLRVNLSSMVRVLSFLQDSPEEIDTCERAKQFGEILQPCITDVAIAFDNLVHEIGMAKSREEIMGLVPLFSTFYEKTEDLQHAFGVARRKLFYEMSSPNLEAFVPLMSFYLFTIISFRDTVEVFQRRIQAYECHPWCSTLKVIKKVTMDQFFDNLSFLQKLVRQPRRREWQRVLEAVKVSGAMILTVGFTYLIDTEKAYISGPNIIAFVAGFNTVEAVQASIVRLTGCLLGTVFGFFASTYSSTSVQRVASLCVLMFAGTFLRNDKEYGIMAVYGMFVLIPLDGVTGVSLEEAVARMNQNTFGIFIYLFVIALIYPLSPRKLLLKKRRRILQMMMNTLTPLMKLCTSPEAPGYSTFNNAEEEDFDVKMGQSIFMVCRNDEELERIGGVISDLKKELKSSKELMNFVREERGILESRYPSEACGRAFVSMRRMGNLLETMWMSWKVIRSQGKLSAESRRMIENISPVAMDVSNYFSQFVSLMSCMLDEPRLNVEAELTKVVLALIEASQELHTRKSKIMVLTILKSVEQYREQGSGRSASVMEFPCSTTSSGGLKGFPERDITILPELQRGKSHSVLSPVTLPSNFVIPFPSEHAEGMHSLSLSLEMFANETKLLMVELFLILDEIRSTL